jgi:DNA-binding response OmpR family regulator
MVLDLMLPGLDGLAVCKAMRADRATAAVPIIMLTARAEEADRVAGLELGADDYLTKPFSPRELVARVNALLRRVRSAEPSGDTRVLTLGDIAIDLDRHRVTDGGREVHLTAKEFLLLQYFLEHRDRVLSRDLLLSDVWGYSYTGGTRTVDVHVRRLREKLPLLSSTILTIKQFGYKLAEEPGSEQP